MVVGAKGVKVRNSPAERLIGSGARIYRILRLRPCSTEEIATVTGFSLSLIDDAIRKLLGARLIIEMRHNRFFSRANAVWRYQRPQRGYLAAIIVGSILVPLGVNVTYFLFAPGIILLGVYVSLFV